MTELKDKLIVEFTHTPVTNYAIQQNRIPLARKLILENLSDNDLYNLEVEIIGEPGFVHDWSHRIEMLPKNQRMEVDVSGLHLSGKFLSELTEKLVGEITLSIAFEHEVLFKEIYKVDILAYDQWNGVGTLPEMLAAFVTPNHPEIVKIIQRASTILEEWTGNSAFDAYQSLNPDRVKKQMGAIFEAIADLGIVYCSPPPSFENEGQRIRTCDTISYQKLATCIDMAILYASCIEAIGLNPLLIIVNGHAFVGAWLIDDTFVNSVNDDITFLKKRTAGGINEIALVEATSMNAGQNQTFDESINSANYRLVHEDDFVLFIDVKRARFSHIKPLPQRIKTSEGWEIIENKKITSRGSRHIPEGIIDEGNIEIIGTNQFTKQKLWERKLLDLSLRNNLLNLRVSQRTIQLLSVDLSTFEDALAAGDEFQISTKPDELINPEKESGVYQALNMSDPTVELLDYELSHKRIRTYLTEADLKSSLTKLYRASRLSLEENGANTLYLALGFLKWYETPKSELARYAPILLLPVEIIRKSAQKGYIIRSREEETLMNITLLEMLKQDFQINIHGLDELPRDHSGVDVTKIFSIFRRGIMSQARWDLEEHAFLGIFSFSKFIMWNDIHNNADKLADNKVVKSLISGKLEWELNEAPTESNLDNKYHPSEIALPISADSTQLEAICAANQNTSFILHGPPGTGKSQTITNIIANALYQGKKVLFAAEKMAALSVVQKKLANIGLDPYCLELHSKKSKKSSILDQLRKTTEVIRKSSPLEFSSEAERLHNQRIELNEYVEALHKKFEFGFSLYDSFTGYAELSSAKDSISFDEKLIVDLTKEKFVEWCDLIEELQYAGTLCGHPHNHSLAQINTTSYSQQKRTNAEELVTKYVETLNRKIGKQKELCEILLVDESNFDKEKTEGLEKLSALITSLPDSPERLTNARNPERTLGHIIKLASHGLKRDTYRDKLLKDFSIKILSFEAKQNFAEWERISQSWFLPKILGQSKIKKKLRPLSKKGKVRAIRVAEYLETIILYQNEQKILDRDKAALSRYLDFMWNNGDCDWTTIIQICEANIQINQLLVKITEDVSKVTLISNNLADYLSNGSQTFLDTKGKTLLSYIEIVEQQKEIERDLSGLLEIDFTLEQNSNEDWSKNWKQNAENWFANLALLRDWTSWNRVKEKVLQADLFPVIKSYTKGDIENEQVLLSFKKSLYKHFSEYIITKDSRLSVFNGKLFEGKIQKFKEQSQYFEELTKAELFAKLASNIPSFTQEASNNSEIGILQRAIRNNGRAMSIRRLFDLIPNLLPRMCPCMLMSPISVAQYFEVDSTKFDLVIFDEASQMPTFESVGAMARGQNVIVVGDPKQMPPSSFFSTNYFDEENAEKEDLESILDDCLALSMPSKHLLWHYRSKHESLIAFSNSNYYENKLLTFPSPDDIATKVSNIYVEGYYDRGKTRQNKFEARAIVEEVLRRLSDPGLRQRSIGIVTFSSVQQNLIEDLLNEAFDKKPDLEKIAFECSEPIFIKNLENVQGDERDVILFSVGYGPDKNGKTYMNFGPLNGEGGWRRLNVAVSRARYEMKVFSTLRSDQIDISRTSSVGVAGIKAFLEYTEEGKIALPQNQSIERAAPRYFENMVAKEIQKFGYTVQTGIGCSGYQIDIGVVNPENPTEYILGILTDGNTYLKAKTAKDREVVQPDVLKMLGWNLYRLWSPDWWDNPQKATQDIIKAIKEAQAPDAKKKDPETISASSEIKREVYAGIRVNEITQEVIQPKENFTEYKIARLNESWLYSSNDFFDPHILPKIHKQIDQVLDQEAPLSHSLLSKRILNAWGISRLGVKLNDYLTGIYFERGLKYTKQNGSYFYWKNTQVPENYNSFRRPGIDENKRNAEDLPKEEVACGVKEILINQISLPKEDLIREVAKLFCYTRLGGNVENSMKLGIDYALERKIIKYKNERIVLP